MATAIKNSLPEKENSLMPGNGTKCNSDFPELHVSKFSEWILCPICRNKTRVKIRLDTELKNFPLFCPKCKRETLIKVKQLHISIIEKPDA